MTEDEAHVVALREAYRRWDETKGGSVDHWLSLMTDDVEFRSLAGVGPDGGPAMGFKHVGSRRDQVRVYFREMAQEWEMVHFRPREYVAQGDKVAVLGECAWRSRRSGKVSESPFAHFFTFRERKICAIVELFDTATAVAVHGAPRE